MPQDAPGCPRSHVCVPKNNCDGRDMATSRILLNTFEGLIRIDHPGDSAVRYVKHIGRRFKNGFREVTPCVTDLTERGSF